MKTYNCFLEQYDGENFDISQLYDIVKNRCLIEIELENGYAIRQWKDIDVQYIDQDNGTFDMKYGMLYCTLGNNIESVWNSGTQDDLQEWIETCENYI